MIGPNGKGASSFKENRDRVSLMCCTSASGSHKVPLAVIGKSKLPICFKKIRMDTFSVKYMSQTKAWINKVLFKQWLQKFLYHR